MAGINVNNKTEIVAEIVPSADTFSNKKAKTRMKGGSKAFKGRSLTRPPPPRFRHSHPPWLGLFSPPPPVIAQVSIGARSRGRSTSNPARVYTHAYSSSASYSATNGK